MTNCFHLENIAFVNPPYEPFRGFQLCSSGQSAGSPQASAAFHGESCFHPLRFEIEDRWFSSSRSSAPQASAASSSRSSAHPSSASSSRSSAHQASAASSAHQASAASSSHSSAHQARPSASHNSKHSHSFPPKLYYVD